jgi:hypothetical protein
MKSVVMCFSLYSRLMAMMKEDLGKRKDHGFKTNRDTTIEGTITCHSNPYQFVLGHRLGIFISTILAHCHFCCLV